MATSVYLLYNFNSYHNRVIKKYDTLTEYLTYQTDNNNLYDLIANCNFDYRDGVTAGCTYNLGAGFNYDNSPNYALVVNSSNEILSRWYVVDAVKTRGGQYSLTLTRDAIADYKSEVITAPCFIEKATLGANNPLIFNRENVSFNQIKSTDGEYLLKDETLTPWIVGYMAKSQDDETDTEIKHTLVARADIETTQYTGLTDFLMNYDPDLAALYTAQGSTMTLYDPTKWYYDVPFYIARESVYGSFRINVGTRKGSYLGTLGTTPTSYGETSSYYTNTSLVSNLNSTLSGYRGTNLQTAVKTYLTSPGYVHTIGADATQSFIDSLLERYDNKIVNVHVSSGQDAGDHYYRLNIRKSGTAVSPISAYYFSVDSTEAQAALAMYGVYNSASGFTLGTHFDNYFYIKNLDGYIYQYTLEVSNELPAPSTGIETKIDKDRRPLDDAPYCMFAIPWNDFTFRFADGTIESTAINNRAIASAIVEKMANKVYDLQLLPYCPYRNLINADHEIDFRIDNTLVAGEDYSFIESADTTPHTNIGVILWPHTSTDSFYISYSYEMPVDPIQIKIDNETKQWRLCSPNYAAIYEFSPVKNNGISRFNIDFTYKPYTPYIHVNPDFGGLYGEDWDDARGLICAGDFSLPQTTDQWAQFEINNKNYQNSFNRQIDTQDTVFNRQWLANWASVGAGAASAGVSGGIMGAAVGGPVGAAVGAIGGAAASLGGGIADQIIAKKNYETQRENTIEQFEMQLQNVKARPDTLSKVSAYNKNNKLWPFVEYYHATETEETAFRNKLIYNGMTVGIIDTIDGYLQVDPTYIKAKLIRLNINEDNHLVEHITDELNKGVYI